MQEKLVNSAYDEGLNHGIQQGIKQEKSKFLDAIKNLLKSGVDKETIMKTTHLTEEEIKKIEES